MTGPVGAKQPIVIGNVGTWSGPLGAGFAGAVVGSQLWARTVNEAGGIDGHPVKVISLDDAGDPSRSKANVKELVEKRGAVAFMADFSPITRSAHSDYLREKGIPVVAGDQGTPEWHKSPVYFRAGSNAMVLVYGAVYEAAHAGKRKLAFAYCVEIPDCKTASVVGRQAAGEQGMSMVYEAGISVGQPDFTAECLQAQRSGADTIYVLGDPNTVGRFTRSCDRQGYHPLFIGASAGIDSNLAKATGIQGGLRATQPQPPWFLRAGTPAIAAYAAARERYAPGAKEGQDVIIGWIAGKMIEQALANAAPLGATVAPADFLRGFGRYRNETVGGLIPPTTFTAGEPTTDQGNCWYATSVEAGKWTAPNGAKPTCINLTLKV